MPHFDLSQSPEIVLLRLCDLLQAQANHQANVGRLRTYRYPSKEMIRDMMDSQSRLADVSTEITRIRYAVRDPNRPPFNQLIKETLQSIATDLEVDRPATSARIRSVIDQL